MTRVVVLGGAGFIGAAIVRAFSELNASIRIVDAFFAETFADRTRVADAAGLDEIIAGDVGAIPELPDILDWADVVVDAMGWSRHREAEKDPARDMALNLGSHLAVLRVAREIRPRPLVSFGSRHQFGAASGAIDDDAPFQPIDVQSVHKTAAERHFHLFAERHRWPVAILRFGNAFGPGQPIGDGDVGLIGGFLRDLLRGRTIEVFEGERRRNLAYGPDIARLTCRLAALQSPGCSAFNFSGTDISVVALAQKLAARTGSGRIVLKPMPAEVAAHEIGDAQFVSSGLKRMFGDVETTDLDIALAQTVSAVKARAGAGIGDQSASG